MEHETNLPYDYARCDRVWQRVSPELNPYPEAREAVIAPPAPHREECCLASAAEQELENIRAFIEEELEDRRTYLTYARCAPNANARRILREIAAGDARVRVISFSRNFGHQAAVTAGVKGVNSETTSKQGAEISSRIRSSMMNRAFPQKVLLYESG